MTLAAIAAAPPPIPPGLLVSAASSRAGKTTVTLGLARALKDRGLAVQAFKSGPDYIDPAFHHAATGRFSFNLDGWSMGRTQLESIMARASGADIVIAEGAMGLFDGVAHRGAYGNGAAADIAALAGWPVVLVIDCASQAQTAAAVAHGLATFRPDVTVAGVILNRISGARHEALVRAGFDGTGLEILGVLPRAAAIELPERHLGLVQAGEHGAKLEIALSAAARLIADNIDLDAVVGNAAAATPASRESAPALPPPGQRIALARDDAFSFAYPHLIEGWREAGAEIAFFSPLANEPPDPHADVCWLPGGYPELHAGRLATARGFLAGLRAFAETKPVHGECGGYMVLGQALIDADGISHPMAGLLGLVTSYERRTLHLGYRLAELAAPVPGFPAGTRLRGHEFHYSSILDQPDEPLAKVFDAAGREVAETGSCRGNVTGSFFHLVAADT